MGAPFYKPDGAWAADFIGGTVSLVANDSFACAAAGAMPMRCRISATVAYAQGRRGYGIMVRSSTDPENAYYIRTEPSRHRLVSDSWPRKGDIPHRVRLERPLEARADRMHSMVVLVDGSVCELYVDDRIAMSTRRYDLAEGG
jgi:beta-fructofuranosidase